MANMIVLITSAFIAGIGLAGICNWTLAVLYLLALLLAVVAAWRIYKKPEQAVWPLAALFLIAGMIRFIHADTVSPFDISHHAGQKLAVNGTVADIPQITPSDEHKVKVKYIVRVENVKGEHSRGEPASGKMIVSVRQEEDAAVATYGAKVTADGQVMLLHGYNNPGMFDNVAAQKRQGITARMAIPFENLAIRSTGTADNSWEALLVAWRGEIIAGMQKVMPAGDAAILSGMLFGGYSGIRRETVNDFATTGIVHILSVSGTHIAVIS